MEILTLVENLTYRQGTKGEHGLSFLVRTGDKEVLFDTGQSDLLIRNAQELGVDLASVDQVVISHGHYDHTGGLGAFFEVNDHAPVWIKAGAFEEKFSRTTGQSRYIGISQEIKTRFRSRFCFVEDEEEIAPGLKIIPTIDRYYGFEQPSSVMQVRREGQMVPDPFADELFVVYEHSEGSTVFAGCAHRGIGNICRTAMDVTGHNTLRLVIGGTHLKGVSAGKISKTVEAFGKMKVEQFALAHCTGIPAFMAFSEAFWEKVRYAHVGTRFLPYETGMS
ncbi:MAG: MBL fold metallo-hydrolase [Marinilabilia sp.]